MFLLNITFSTATSPPHPSSHAMFPKISLSWIPPCPTFFQYPPSLYFGKIKTILAADKRHYMEGHLTGTRAQELSNKKMLPQDNRTTFVLVFTKNKNNVVSIHLHWKQGDRITEVCVFIKQIDAATCRIC